MKKQDFIKGSVILMASAVAAKALGAVFKIPLTNLLGGVGMSYFSCAYSLFMPVYALTVTGLTSAVARMTAQSAALGLYRNVRRIRRVALGAFAAAGLLGSAAVGALAVPFSRFSGSPQAWLAVAMIAPAVLLGCLTAVERGICEGMSNMYPTALSQVAEGVVKVAAGLWLCSYVMENSSRFLAILPGMTDVRALAAAAGILGVTLSSLGALLFFAVMRMFCPAAPQGGEPLLMSRRRIAGELLRTALPTGLGAVVTNLASLIDMYTMIGCIRHFGARIAPPPGVTDGELPHFIYGSFAGIALTVFNLVPSVTNMLGKGILPPVTAAWAEGDRPALRRHTMQALLASAAIALPAAVGMAVLPRELLTVLFPRQSDEVEICVGALRLLMPGMVCLCMAFPVFSMLQAIGRASAPLKIMAAATVLKLAGNLLLVPLMGAGGAALSTTLCYSFILAAALRSYLRRAELSLSIKPFLSVIYAGAMCGGAAFVVNCSCIRGELPPLWRLLLSAAAGGAAYMGTLWGTGAKKRLHIRPLHT